MGYNWDMGIKPIPRILTPERNHTRDLIQYYNRPENLYTPRKYIPVKFFNFFNLLNLSIYLNRLFIFFISLSRSAGSRDFLRDSRYFLFFYFSACCPGQSLMGASRDLIRRRRRRRDAVQRVTNPIPHVIHTVSQIIAHIVHAVS